MECSPVIVLFGKDLNRFLAIFGINQLVNVLKVL